MIYPKFSHGAASYTVKWQSANVMLESLISAEVIYLITPIIFIVAFMVIQAIYFFNYFSNYQYSHFFCGIHTSIKSRLCRCFRANKFGLLIFIFQPINIYLSLNLNLYQLYRTVPHFCLVSPSVLFINWMNPFIILWFSRMFSFHHFNKHCTPPPPLLAVPRRLFCFGSLVILDVVFLIFLLYIKNRCKMLD